MNRESAIWTALAVVFLLLAMGFGMEAMANDAKVCTKNTTYPPKIVVVCKTCQCPGGYY